MSPSPSLLPQGMPGGSSKYGTVIALLAVGVGGLLVYQYVLKKAPDAPYVPPVATVVNSVAAPTAGPKEDDIPLPPTVAEVKEAGAPQPRGTGAGVVVGPTGCEAKCTGTPPPELEAAVRGRAAMARRCYNTALAQDPTLKGHVTVALRVSGSGSVCSAAVAGNDMGTPSVASCVANVMRQAGSYPSPKGGCVDVSVPFSFVSQNP